MNTANTQTGGVQPPSAPQFPQASTSAHKLSQIPHSPHSPHSPQLFLAQRLTSGLPAYTGNTLKAYSTALNRFAVYLHGKPYERVTAGDAEGYVAWLASPPLELISDKKYPSTHPSWRPFYKSGLAPRSIQRDVTIVRKFYAWLQSVGVIQVNPFTTLRTKYVPPQALERILYDEDIDALEEYLSDPSSAKVSRQRFLFYGYLLTGLRKSELHACTTADLKSKRMKGETIWVLKVKGKGRLAPESHPVPRRFVDELWLYRKSLGLRKIPKEPEALIRTLSGQKPALDIRTVDLELGNLFQTVAKQQESREKVDSAYRLRNTTPHWLRHTFVTRLLDKTSDVPMVASLARHKDIRTTMIYDHTDMIAMSKLLNGE